jgi:hypothetical protein
VNAYRLARWLICSASVLALAGCQLLEGRSLSLFHFASSSAGYAGRFRLAEGRWPGVSELEEFMCVRGRADRHALPLLSCDEVVSSPYRMEMLPLGNDLQIRYFEGDQPVCRLRLIAPRPEPDPEVFPMIIIKSTLFSCPGRPRHRASVEIK